MHTHHRPFGEIIPSERAVVLGIRTAKIGSGRQARLDAERVEQIGELAVQVRTESGDDRIGEAREYRAGLVDGRPR